MVKRIKIGLIYTNNGNWVGGSYYIQNLVYSLNHLPDFDKPEIIVYTQNEAEFSQIKETNYPYLQRKQIRYTHGNLSLFKRVISKLNYFFYKKYLYYQPLYMGDLEVDVIFPAEVALHVPKTVKKLYWIPDFQEQKLPLFFTELQLKNRNQSHYLMARGNHPIIFSSNNALNDFKSIMPKHNCKTYVLNFAVTHPNYSNLTSEDVLKKYNICNTYYFSPNQFWKHKNQMIILKALTILKNKGYNDITIVFSGKEYDGENTEYVDSIKKYVKDNNLLSQVLFLGFIDRKDQLKLMENSIAVIQPSLFEGWSTAVEDAKAMNQYVIASNLDVHKEQLKENVSFFDPNNSIELSHILEKGFKTRFVINKIDYKNNVLKFSEGFINLINQTINA